MRPLICALVLAAAAAIPSASAQQEARWLRFQGAHELQLRDVAAVVRVVPEDRADVLVLVTHQGPLPTPELRQQRGRLIVDGGVRRIESCRALENGGFEVRTRQHGRLQTAQLPRIELRVPRAVNLSAGGAVRLNVAGQAETVRARLGGCGDVEIEGARGSAEITVAGAQDVRLYEAESARIVVAGAGDVVLGAVREGLTVSVAGSGDVTAAHVDGPTSLVIQGSGDITIREGRADPMSVTVAGSGDVVHNGEATRLDVTVVGAGDVRVRRVLGEINRRVIGSGEVVVSQR